MTPRPQILLALALLLLALAVPAAADVAGVWRKLEPEGTPPAGRMSTATVIDGARDRVIVFGGYGHGNFYNDTWALELSPTLRWVQLANAPVTGRHETTAVMDPGSERMLVFGGKNLYGFFGDLLALSLDTDPPAWSIVAQGDVAPGPRETRAVLDAGRRRFVTALGFKPYTHVDDAWAFGLDGGAWTQFAPGPGPTARRGQSATLDGGLDRMLVFGGSDDYNWWNEVWSLDLANPAWTLLETHGTPPSARYGQNLVHDPVRDRLVMFGGYGPLTPADSAGNPYDQPNDFRNDAWVLELSGQDAPRWERINAPDGPSKRDFFAMVWDQKLERVLLFGGNGGFNMETNDVWELTFPRGLPSLDAPPGTLRADLVLVGARSHPGAIEVSFQLPDDKPAKLEAFDATGRRVGAVDVGSLGGGIHTASLARRDGGSPGLFWIRLTRGSEVRVKKVTLY
jgi:hypothetical protein